VLVLVIALMMVFRARGFLVAPQGLGKTMLVQNIAYQAVLAGHHVLFTPAAQLLLDLGAQESARGLARRFQHYSQPALLVVDEVGYLSYDSRAADLLFQVVGRRYEKKTSRSRPTCPSPTGRPCFPTPPPSSIGSSTTRRSSRSKAPAIAAGPPRSSRRPARPRGEPAAVRATPTGGQIPADLHGRQQRMKRSRSTARRTVS
jgi:IstB-like ATP binding protein